MTKEQYIVKMVCDHYDMELKDITTRSRKRKFVVPRQILFAMLYKYTRLSTTKIGDNYGGYSHCNIIHSKKVIDDRLSYDKGFEVLIDSFKGYIDKYKKPKKKTIIEHEGYTETYHESNGFLA